MRNILLSFLQECFSFRLSFFIDFLWEISECPQQLKNLNRQDTVEYKTIL